MRVMDNSFLYNSDTLRAPVTPAASKFLLSKPQKRHIIIIIIVKYMYIHA